MVTSLVLVAAFAALTGLLAGLLIGSRGSTGLRHRAAELDATLRAERAAAQDRQALVTRTDRQLRETFGTLSAEALERSTGTLLRLAEQRLAATATAAGDDLAARQSAIAGLLDPVRTSLEQVHEQLRSVERGRAASDAALSEQLAAMRQTSEHLRQETTQLVTALRAPQVRGRWGELQLERTVEAAGMSEHVDYVTQATLSDADGTVRPDLVVRLVGGKRVVVDSKVAFNAYLEALEAQDEATKANRLKRHARQLREHIDALAGKAYWQRFEPTPEFVVCFVPADAFLDAALREDPTLQEHAFGRNVVLATPSTLVALLRTVAYSWRQDALAANAAEVHKLGKELYQRLCTVGAHLDRLGKSISDAVGHYNSAVTSLDSRVFVSARRMADLKVVEPGETLPRPRHVPEVVRLPQAGELADQRVVALPAPGEDGDRTDRTDRTDLTAVPLTGEPA